MTGPVTDHLLMAYADHELNAAQSMAVEREVAQSPEAHRRLVSFRSTAAIARYAFNAPMWTRPPASIVDLIRSAHSFKAERSPSYPRPSYSRMTRPCTSGLLLMATIGAVSIMTYALLPTSNPYRSSQTATYPLALGLVAADSPIDAALRDPSTGYMLAGGFRLRHAGYHRDKWSNPCRSMHVYENARAGLPSASFVACRSPLLGWNIVGAVTPSAGMRVAAAPYVSTDGEAFDSLASVLKMIGADHYSTTSEPKDKAP